jgi:eight-cysteine-cluster-containing protein
MRRSWLVGLAFGVLAACGFEGVDPSQSHETLVSQYGGRVVISEADPNFRRFELPEAQGECAQDVDCSSAGCSAEVCTTSKQAPEVWTTCDATHPGTEFYCGCVAARCRWYKP